MDTILDNFTSDKLFPNSNLLDLEDLNETDFLSNVVCCNLTFYILLNISKRAHNRCLVSHVFY